jgi:hypothetical protein
MTVLRKALSVAALTVPLGALAYLAADLWQVERVPPMADLRAASDRIRHEWRDGDVVVFDPPWAWEGAPAFAGLEVSLGEALDWYELSKRSRVWVVGSLGRGIRGVPDDWGIVDRWQAGRVDVAIAVPPPRGNLLYDFRAHVPDARVTRVHKAGPEVCSTLKDGRWTCGAPHPWQYVGQARTDAGGAMRDVIWSHPIPDDEPLETFFPAVPLGTTLVVHYGFSQKSMDTDSPGSPLTLRVRIGDEIRLQRVLGQADAPWYEEAIDVSALRGTTADVTFSVVVHDPHWRQVCFTADSWDATP